MRKALRQTLIRPQSLLAIALGIGILAIPLLVIPSARDPFRIPKELLFRAVAITVVAILACGGWRELPRWPWGRRYALLGACVASAVLSTVLSSNRSLSIDSAFTFFAGSVFFAAILCISDHARRILLGLLMLSGVINTIVLLAQVLDLWQPLNTEGMVTALLGNRNDAAAFLLGPSIAGVALTITTRSRLRILCSIMTLILMAGLIASQNVSAATAFLAALGVFLLAQAHLRRVALIAAVTLLVATTATIFLAGRWIPELDTRLREKISALQAGDLDRLTTGRLGSTMAAMEMFRMDPVLGTGLGTYGYQYLPARLHVERQYVEIMSPTSERRNFGEAHNEHAQILAEQGIVGYATFVLILVFMARLSLSRDTFFGRSFDSHFAQVLAAPLVIGVATVCIGQFPFRLAAPRAAFLTLAALCSAWIDPYNRDA